MKDASLQVRFGKVGPGEIGIGEVGLTDLAFEEEGIFEIEVREVAGGDQAILERHFQKRRVASPKINAHEFAVDKLGILEPASLEFCEAEITLLERAIDKPPFHEFFFTPDFFLERFLLKEHHGAPSQAL